MKRLIARLLLFIAAFTSAFAQPVIPISNLSPVSSGTLIGRYSSGAGRGQSITIGAGLSLSALGELTSSGSSGAPSDATFITQIPNATLTNEQALSALATGIMMSAITTGVITTLAPGTSGNVVTSNGTAWVSGAAPSTGNVTAAGTLTSGDIIIGQGSKAVASSSVISISGSNATVTGNLAITGNTTFANLTTGNLILTGNITSTTVTDGQFFIGNGAADRLQLGTITAGSGVTVTPTAGGITIDATGTGGTVTVSGTPTSGQIAEWTSATNIQGKSVTGSGNVTLSPGGLTVTTGKVLSATNNLTLSGTDGTTQTFPSTSQTIVGLTATQTISAKQVVVSAALGTDDTWEGVGVSGLLAGATIAQWEAVYVGGSSTYLLADANGSGTYPARGLAVAAYSSTDPAIIVREGTVRNDAWNWTPGGTIYISTTPGGLTQTAPSATTEIVQQVGFALTADIAYVNFASGEYLTVE